MRTSITEDSGLAGGFEPNAAALCEDATLRVKRIAQMRDDAVEEFALVEAALRVVQQHSSTLEDPPPSPPVTCAADPASAISDQSNGRSRARAAAGVLGIALLAGAIGFANAVHQIEPSVRVASLAGDLPVNSPAHEPGAITRDDPAEPWAAAGGPDLGRTIYAARFAQAPASERLCLARAVYYEARGEDVAGQMAVAQVVLNRARAVRWPDSICGVVNQGIERGEKCQFSFACFDHLSAPTGDTWGMAQLIADQAVAGQAWMRELVDATHYHTAAVTPVWRTGLDPIATIGTHIFYREPRGLQAKANPYDAKLAASAAEAVRAKAVAAKAAANKTRPASSKPSPAVADKGWANQIFQQ